MKFTPTTLADVLVIEPEPVTDERGYFARTWCAREFAGHGLVSVFVQNSVSFNPRRGTLRGLHYQAAPHEETKLICCTRGSVYDVLLDLRTGSPTFGKWEAFEMTWENHRHLYVPAGVAHGFLTLADYTEVSYQISAEYNAEAARGVRWDDPAFGIAWPTAPRLMSHRDRNHPLWNGQPATNNQRGAA